MTIQLDNNALPSPIDLLDSARQKYTLAQGRIRRGSPELALLSLHGSLEDALRAHAIHRRLAVAAAPFPQLLDGLASDEQAPLSVAEADGIHKMHRLRARVAHGEQITVAGETITAYQRLAVRLLPRYGVLVVGPEEEPEQRAPRDDAPGTRPLVAGSAAGRRPGETGALAARGGPRGTGSTYPLLDRYPDLAPGGERVGPTRSRRGIDEAERTASFFERSQSWLLPLLIIVTIFLIGATISIALQGAGEPKVPSTELQAATFAPELTTAPPASGASVFGVAASAVPTGTTLEASSPAPTTIPGELTPGVVAYVRAGIDGLNLRAQPGTDQAIVLSLAPATEVEVLEGPVDAGGLGWWRVRSAGVEGWCAGDLLELR